MQRLVRAVPIVALISTCAACAGEPRPGQDITAEVRDALVRGDLYQIRPRTFSRFDCICVFTSYEDDAEGSMDILSRSQSVKDCDVRNVPLNLDEFTGVFLLIDRSVRPARMEFQSFDRAAAAPLSALTTVHRGCERAVRARVTDRPGHNALETFLL